MEEQRDEETQPGWKISSSSTRTRLKMSDQLLAITWNLQEASRLRIFLSERYQVVGFLDPSKFLRIRRGRGD